MSPVKAIMFHAWTGRQLVRVALVALLIGSVTTSILASDAAVLSGVNVTVATSVAGGFTLDNSTPPKFLPAMYVMTLVNVNSSNENDVVTRLTTSGSVGTFFTLPVRDTITRPTVDIAVVTTLVGDFGGNGYFGYVVVARAKKIFLINPYATPTPTYSILVNDIEVALGASCAADASAASAATAIKSIVVGSELFNGRVVGLCANGTLFTVAPTSPAPAPSPPAVVGTVASVVSLAGPGGIGRIDVAPANYWHYDPAYGGTINLGHRILAYRSDHHLLAIGASSPNQVVEVDNTTALIPTGTVAAVRTVPPRLCDYLVSGNTTVPSAVIASDLYIPANNRNDLLRFPQSSFEGRQGQVLLWGQDGSRVQATWSWPAGAPNPTPISFTLVHSATATAGLTDAANVPNGIAHCPTLHVVIQTNPTSAGGNPNKGGEGSAGNITFVIVSVVIGTTTVFNPQNIVPGSVKFGATGVEAVADCTGAQSDVNGDGVPDLHCKAKAADTNIPPGATGVATFTINPPGWGD